jgi:hypothetical protein
MRTVAVTVFDTGLPVWPSTKASVTGWVVFKIVDQS